MIRPMIIVAALFLATGPALAVDLTKQILDTHGRPVPDEFFKNKGSRCGEAVDFECLTMGNAMVNSLTFSFPDEQGAAEVKGVKKRRGELAKKINGADKIEFSPGDAQEVLTTVTKLYGPWIVDQVAGVLGPTETK